MGKYAGHEDSDDEVNEALEDSSELNKTLSELVDGKPGPPLSSVFQNGDSVLPNGDLDNEANVCESQVLSKDSVPAESCVGGTAECAEDHSTACSEDSSKILSEEKLSDDVPVDKALPGDNIWLKESTV